MEREREGGRERERERERDRDRDRERQRQRQRETEAERQREKETETESQTDRQTDRDSDRENRFIYKSCGKLSSASNDKNSKYSSSRYSLCVAQITNMSNRKTSKLLLLTKLLTRSG